MIPNGDPSKPAFNAMSRPMRQGQADKLLHAIQTGVKFDMQTDPSQADVPSALKHLRVGVNHALVQCGVLTKLLIAKGVFTEDEYFETYLDTLAAEVAKYEAILTARLGRPVTLV